jgi:hypothetical protein
MKSEISLVDNREVVYESLFNGEMPIEPQPSIEDIGLTGLWRLYTEKFGRNGDDLNGLLNSVPSKVNAILTEHDIHASSGEDNGEAIFSFINPELSLHHVSDVTSNVMAYWEKALYRNNYKSIFGDSKSAEGVREDEKSLRLANYQSTKSLVLETAAAVMQVMPLWSEKPFNPSAAEKNKLALVLANWGPKFFTEWMNGTILRNWINQNAISDDDADAYQELFSPSNLKRFAINNISNPLDAFDKVAANLAYMNDDVIAEYLGWSKEDVNQLFTPGIRRRFAINNISNPLDAFDKVAANLELLTDEVLVECLGWSRDEIKEIFTPGLRVHIAVRYGDDPLSAANDYIEGKIQYFGRTFR